MSGAFRFVLADAELLERLIDKARFEALAERHELPVPAAQRLRPSPEARHLIWRSRSRSS
jgi:D-aspartate ligase